MPTEVRIPQLSLTMAEGRITHWIKHEGDRVLKGEPLYELETDKVITDVNSPVAGVLARVLVPDGASAAVLSVVGLVADVGENVASWAPTPGATAPTDTTSAPALVRPAGSAAERIFVSPRARKLAEAEGVDLSSVGGTGPGGRIMEKDVLRAIAERAPAAPAPAIPPAKSVVTDAAFRSVPLAGMRATIAQRMKRSQDTVAAVTLTAEVDMAEATKLRAQANTEWGRQGLGKLTFTDVVVKSVAKALREQPALNSSLVGDEIRDNQSVNVGVAVALDAGLIVPVVRDADSRSLRDVSAAIRELSDRARRGALRPEEVSGGTFTVTNMGMMGVETFTPIINLPECAILGVGRIADRPVARDGQVVVRPTMWLSLTFDHRIIDGAPAAAFLQRVKDLLENPYLLFV